MRRLKDLRRARHLSQEELARILGVTSTAISNYESGKREPEIDIIKKAADYFCTSVDYIVGFSDLENKNLSKEEEKLLTLFRRYSVEEQKHIIELYLLITKSRFDM